jgi:ribosomal protein S18 acetylase RimI-like enzyme
VKNKKVGFALDGEMPHIDVRAVHNSDAAKIQELDCSFESDRIYTLRIENRLLQNDNGSPLSSKSSFTFELLEMPVDPPIYKKCWEYENTLADVETKLRRCEGGYVALADGIIAGCILLKVETWHAVAHIQDLIVGHQFGRYGVGSLLLTCAADWGRKRGCWAIVLEAQNNNYPAVQFYLRNGFDVWSINQHFYPPGPIEHEVAIVMGKRLKSGP